jgi:hypothetical protein
LPIGEHGPSAQHCPHHSRAQGPAEERGDPMALVQMLAVQLVVCRAIYEHQVRVGVRLDPALPREPEAPGGKRREHLDDAFAWESILAQYE